MARYLVIALLLFAFVTGAAANSKDDSLIVPSRSLGPISLGMTLAEIEEVLGAPAQSYPDAHAYVWYPRQPSGPLMAIVGPDGKVNQVKAYWDVYYTTQGRNLHTGMLEDNVRGLLGRPLKTQQWSHFKILYYRGMTFTVDINNFHIITCVAVIPSKVSAQATR